MSARRCGRVLIPLSRHATWVQARSVLLGSLNAIKENPQDQGSEKPTLIQMPCASGWLMTMRVKLFGVLLLGGRLVENVDHVDEQIGISDGLPFRCEQLHITFDIE